MPTQHTTIPLLKICSSLVIGILIAHHIDSACIVATFVITILVCCILVLFRKSVQFQTLIKGSIYSLLIICFGSCLYFVQNSDKQESSQVYEILEIKETSNGNTVCVVQSAVRTKYLAYFDTVIELNSNQQIITNEKPSAFQEPTNPHAFDYKRYQLLNGIKGSFYLKEKDYRIQRTAYSQNLYITSIQYLKHRLTRFLDTYFKFNKAKSIASALLLGDKSMLNDDSKLSFSTTGTMHILAISGLHVGIIFLICSNILPKRLFQPYRLLILRTSIILGVIWFYAAVAGFSVSVLRASIMFSLIAVGKTLNRSINVFNLLAGAAIIILIINPNELFSVGFQLSFSAVAGIIYFQPRLERLISSKFTILNKIWSLAAVTLAAQIATAPIAMYYFGTFPTYFLPANMIVVPLVTFMLFSGIILLVFGDVSFIAEWSASILEKLISASIYITEYFADLPSSSIPIGAYSYEFALLLMICSYTIFAYLSSKSLSALKLSSLSIILLLCGSIYHVIGFTPTLTIYHLKDAFVADYHNSSGFYTASTTKLSPKTVHYNVKPNRRVMGNNFIDSMLINTTQPTTSFVLGNQVITRIQNTYALTSIVLKNTDILCLGDNAFITNPELLLEYPSTKIIAEATNNQKYLQFWTNFAELHHLNFYNIKSQGAFQKPIHEL